MNRYVFIYIYIYVVDLLEWIKGCGLDGPASAWLSAKSLESGRELPTSFPLEKL